jgi:hypothetical protein
MATGYEKAKAKAEALRSEAVVKDNELAEFTSKIPVVSGEIASKFKEYAELGSENVSGLKVPQLKIHVANKSKNNILADGTEPNNGWYFYTHTQEQYQQVLCHILYVTNGYYAKPMEGSDKDKSFNQLISGLIVDGEEFRPFVYYLSGLKLQPMWDFMGAVVSKVTRDKQNPVPMFALEIAMGVAKTESKFGQVFIPTFELKGVTTDIGRFQFLADSVPGARDMAEQIKANSKIEIPEAVKTISHEDIEQDQADASLVRDAQEIFGA